VKKLKKNYSIVLICALLTATLMFSTVALAKGDLKKKPKNPIIGEGTPVDPNGPLELDKSQMLSIEEITEPLGEYAIVVYINVPCDEEWRATYQTAWKSQANYAIEVADNKLYEWFTIDYRTANYNEWDSNDTFESLGLLNEAVWEVGLQGKDIMIAYSAQRIDDGVAGRSYWGGPYALVRKQGSGTDWKVTRHESGHNYGQSHCSGACIMNGSSSFYNYASYICSSHKTNWYGNRYWY